MGADDDWLLLGSELRCGLRRDPACSRLTAIGHVESRLDLDRRPGGGSVRADGRDASLGGRTQHPAVAEALQQRGQQLVADDAFGADLYGRLPGQGNLVFSPASIATALRLVLLGARGETATQIAAALHLAIPDGAAPALEAAQELKAFSALLGDLAAGDLTLRAPNAMWIQSGLPLEPGFTAAVAAAAAVTVRDADF